MAILTRGGGGGGGAGGAPSGPAGGDLAGTYPNPTLAAGVLLFDAYAYLQDQKANGNQGGVAGAAGSWHTRTLNTEVSDAEGMVALAANQFTLQAGTYVFSGSAPFQNTNNSQLRVRNITAGTTAARGAVEIIPGGNVGGFAIVKGVTTVAVATVFELQYRIAVASGNASDLGAGTDWDDFNVFGDLEIWRFAS